MKKIMALILSIFIVVCFVACENTFDTNKPDADGAGLYVTGTDELIYSWSKMVQMGWINADGSANLGYKDNIAGKLVFPSAITTVPESAFSWCFNLEEIVLPETIKEIDTCAFDGCTALTNVTISGNVGESAFAFCTSLKNVIISEGVTRIDKHAFSGCESLEKITIPKSIKNIGTQAFNECEKLEEIIYGGTKEEWRSIEKPYIPIELNVIDFRVLDNWDEGTDLYTIKCVDGDIAKYDQ